jgi:hypothetical protein
MVCARPNPAGLPPPGTVPAGGRGARGIADVTTGNTTVSCRQGGTLSTVHGNAAGRGYDLASGVGTVNAPYFVRELAAAVGPEKTISTERAELRALISR